jgi:hypothetical protein
LHLASIYPIWACHRALYSHFYNLRLRVTLCSSLTSLKYLTQQLVTLQDSILWLLGFWNFTRLMAGCRSTLIDSCSPRKRANPDQLEQHPSRQPKKREVIESNTRNLLLICFETIKSISDEHKKIHMKISRVPVRPLALYKPLTRLNDYHGTCRKS